MTRFWGFTNQSKSVTFALNIQNCAPLPHHGLWALARARARKVCTNVAASRRHSRIQNAILHEVATEINSKHNMPTAYDSSLKAVQDKEHSLVYQYQFKKLEVAGGQQWWNVRDLKTGVDQKISGQGRTYSDLRCPSKNKLIWADTLKEQSQAEILGDGQAPQSSAAAPAAPASAAPAPAPSGRKINRDFKLNQRVAILNEVLFGTHLTRKGDKISPFRRNEHGMNGVFFLSVCTHLNAQVDGPFKDRPAVPESIRAFLESAVAARKLHLEGVHGVDYMQRKAWDVYSDAEDDGTTEDQLNAKMSCSIREALDALIYCQFDATDDKPDAGKAYTDKDDETVAARANGSGTVSKRARTECPEKMRAKPTSAVAQFEAKQDSVSSMMASLSAMLSSPAAGAVALASPATPAPDQFDPELIPLLNALKGLKEPPGTTTVCKMLASSLGNYGVGSLEELRLMDDATSILLELKWTALQIKKVLHPTS